MNLLAPLKTPAKNTEQKIFKLFLFVVLPLLGILTVYLFITINTNKIEAIQGMIGDQSGNANKRIAGFFDPISRDIGYLQTLGNAGELNPLEPENVQKKINPFAESHLRRTQRIIFRGSDTTLVYTISDGSYTKIDELIAPNCIEFMDEVRSNAEANKINWHKGTNQSSILAVTKFSLPANGLSYAIATETDATVFFKGLQKYTDNHLFLLSDSSNSLPYQFLFTAGAQPEIVETNDPLILTAYAQWKKNVAEKPETVFSITFDSKSWWVSVRRLEIKDRKLYSGYVLPESQLLSRFHIVRRIIAGISAISFAIVLIATIFLWRRFQRDIKQSALPPAVNKMTNEEVLQTICAGEDDRLEFKSTLRWNLKTNKPDKAMEIACLKTIAAFLNSEGGTLLVGVEDDGNILGIGTDQFPNEDKFLLHFNNLINQHLGLENADSFSFDIRHLDGGDIMIVDCLPSPAPVYVTHDRKEEFYVRVGPGTRPLTTRDALEYIRNHF
ncbi:MAG: AlbA family DNA-binding domain-containing protein [Planctomycetota bacterium]|jgi:hypothetical protein